MKYISIYPKEDKKRIKKDLEALRQRLLKQNELFSELYLKPNRDLIKEIEKFVLGKTPNERLKRCMDARGKRYKEVFKTIRWKQKINTGN